MPRRDGTGPEGFGPLTGRGWGFCPGYGMGRRGYGYGPRFYRMTEEDEKALLEEEREELKRELKRIEGMLDKMGE